MKIALWHDLPSGGGKRAFYDHVAGLVARGHQVGSWCTPKADQKFLPLSNLVPEHVVDMRDELGNGALRWLDARSRGTLSTLRRVKAMDDHARRCAEQMRDFGADVLYAGSSLTMAASPIGRYVDFPSVLYLQEPYRSFYEARPVLLWVARPRGKTLKQKLKNVGHTVRLQAVRAQARAEWENAHAFDRVLVNSYFSRETIMRTYGLDAKVCYLGVDLQRYVDRGERRGHVVVGIGQFSPHKRLEAAVRAVAYLDEPRPELAWIGNYAHKDYLAEMESLAQQLGVRFVPHRGISHEAVVDVLNRAAALVYAPLLEPFGYAPLEAAACGVPVVAKAEGGIRETVLDGQTGYLVDNDEDLGPALGQLLGDSERARRMGKAGRQDAERRWSLEAALDRLERHLAEVVSAGRPGTGRLDTEG